MPRSKLDIVDWFLAVKQLCLLQPASTTLAASPLSSRWKNLWWDGERGEISDKIIQYMQYYIQGFTFKIIHPFEDIHTHLVLPKLLHFYPHYKTRISTHTYMSPNILLLDLILIIIMYMSSNTHLTKLRVSPRYSPDRSWVGFSNFTGHPSRLVLLLQVLVFIRHTYIYPLNEIPHLDTPVWWAGRKTLAVIHNSSYIRIVVVYILCHVAQVHWYSLTQLTHRSQRRCHVRWRYGLVPSQRIAYLLTRSLRLISKAFQSYIYHHDGIVTVFLLINY